MTVLVTGATGYLGAAILRAGASGDVRGVGSADLDVRDAAAVAAAVQALRPRAIIHAAAANPGAADDDLERVNVGGTANVAHAAAAVGARVVMVSTDLVHDGTAAPYADDAAPAPVTAYGRSKAAAERALLELCDDAVAVRTSLIVGLRAMDRTTAGFAARLAAGEPVRLFRDCIRQPILDDALAAALLALARMDEVPGTLNVAGEEAMSRAELARRMLAYWKVPGRERVEEVDTPAGVPRDTRLDTSGARAMFRGMALRPPPCPSPVRGEE